MSAKSGQPTTKSTASSRRSATKSLALRERRRAAITDSRAEGSVNLFWINRWQNRMEMANDRGALLLLLPTAENDFQFFAVSEVPQSHVTLFAASERLGNPRHHRDVEQELVLSPDRSD